MGKHLAVIFGVLLLLSSSFVYNVDAQNVLPEIYIDCDIESQINVYPGSVNSRSFYCIITNPTTYTEEVEVTIESGVLFSVGPGTITVGPSADVEIVISVRAVPSMMAQTIPVETKAVVTSANGIDTASLPEASDSATTSAVILEYSSPTIELMEAEIRMDAASDGEVSVIYGNNGNGPWDTINIGISDYSRAALEDAGFTISIRAHQVEIETGDTAAITFEFRAPKDANQGEEYFLVEFYGESDFSCKYEMSGCNRVSITATIVVSEDTSEGVIQALGDNSVVVFGGIGGGILVVAVVVVVLKRKRQPQFVSEEDEFVEDDFDDELEDDFFDDFDDDLEDDFFDDL